MTTRLAALLVLPFPLAFSVAMGAGLLGYWQPHGGEWLVCVLGLAGALAACWRLSVEVTTA